jgi:hypothetical protein
LPPLFSVIGSAQLVKRFFKVNGDKDGESGSSELTVV